MDKKNTKHKIGMIFLCKVTFIAKNYFEVETTESEKGVTYINEISDYFVKNINSILNINDIIYLVLKSVRDDGVLVFSFKENKPFFLRAPFEFNFSERSSFQKLFDFTNKEIKRWKK